MRAMTVSKQLMLSITRLPPSCDLLLIDCDFFFFGDALCLDLGFCLSLRLWESIAIFKFNILSGQIQLTYLHALQTYSDGFQFGFVVGYFIGRNDIQYYTLWGFLKMGCTTARDQVYEVKEPQISNRDINQSRNQLGLAEHQHQPYACGYEFGIAVQNGGGWKAGSKMNVMQEEEREKVKAFFAAFDKMRTAYEMGRIDLAFEQQNQLKQLYNQLNFSIVEGVTAQKREEMLRLVEEIEGQKEQLVSFQKQLSQQGWDSVQDIKNIIVKYRKQKSEVKICVETESIVPLDLLVATFSDFSRHHQFLKFAVASKESRKMSLFRRLGEVVFDLPFCCRSASHFQETVYNRLNYNGSVVVGYQSLYKNDKLQDKYQTTPAYSSDHKIDFTSIVCQFKKIGGGLNKISMMMTVKGEIQPIANWVLEKMYLNIGKATFLSLLGRANAFGEQTASQSFEGDDEIYHHFHALLKEDKDKEIP